MWKVKRKSELFLQMWDDAGHRADCIWNEKDFVEEFEYMKLNTINWLRSNKRFYSLDSLKSSKIALCFNK